MNNPGEDYPCFVVDEEILFNFEDFCDKMYNDPLVQKFGFFKVRLHSEIAGKMTSIETFFEKFTADASRAIKKTVLIANPVECGLYGHHQIDASDHLKEQYMNSATADSFVVEDQENCCMKAMANGTDAFLEHYYAEVKSKAVSPLCSKDITAIRNKAAASKAAFDRRQQYQKKATMEEKKKILDLGLQLEKIESSLHSECQCDSCKYLEFEVPLHNDEPIGLLYSAGIEESAKNYVYLTQNFAMAHLCFKNMLGELGSVFGGISLPALYFGTSHSVFPIHVEDLSLWSFNFLLKGFPKLWLVVPPYAVAELSDALSRCGFGAFHRTCRNNLGHKFFIPTPEWLSREHIPFTVVIQNEGEGVVVLPNAAHTGGNLGNNLAQACNFGTDMWIPYGCVSPSCVCLESSVHADLSQIVAIHQPGLLNAFLGHDLLRVVQDEYFLKSILNASRAKPDMSLSLSVIPSKKVHRLKCPVCPTSWACPQKKYVLAHLKKYHLPRLNEDLIVNFVKDKFPSTRK